jgi:acetyltransferase-like isoleucine patch superfamily enzyme
VTWNVTAEDRFDHEAEWMANRLVEQIRPGCIVGSPPLIGDSPMFFRIRRLPRRLIRLVTIELGTLLDQMNAKIASRTLPKFGNTPKGLVIQLPRRIKNSHCIFLGDNVWLGSGTLLNPVTCYPSVAIMHPEKVHKVQEFYPRIAIGNRVTATGHLTIGAAKEVIIEDDVLLASNVTVLDNFHGYDNTDVPYMYQQLSHIEPVLIKRGCWIGENVVILPGVTIGEMTIIGANSVVTKSIPDRCIAVGAPARIIKQWDRIARQWVAYREIN